MVDAVPRRNEMGWSTPLNVGMGANLVRGQGAPSTEVTSDCTSVRRQSEYEALRSLRTAFRGFGMPLVSIW